MYLDVYPYLAGRRSRGRSPYSNIKENYRKEEAGTPAKLKRACKIKNSERLICRLNQHHQQKRPSMKARVCNNILENT